MPVGLVIEVAHQRELVGVCQCRVGLVRLGRIILALALPPGINAKMVNNSRKEGAHMVISRFLVEELQMTYQRRPR